MLSPLNSAAFTTAEKSNAQLSFTCSAVHLHPDYSAAENTFKKRALTHYLASTQSPKPIVAVKCGDRTFSLRSFTKKVIRKIILKPRKKKPLSSGDIYTKTDLTIVRVTPLQTNGLKLEILRNRPTIFHDKTGMHFYFVNTDNGTGTSYSLL